jgi:hypothetical protein
VGLLIGAELGRAEGVRRESALKASCIPVFPAQLVRRTGSKRRERAEAEAMGKPQKNGLFTTIVPNCPIPCLAFPLLSRLLSLFREITIPRIKTVSHAIDRFDQIRHVDRSESLPEAADMRLDGQFIRHIPTVTPKLL